MSVRRPARLRRVSKNGVEMIARFEGLAKVRKDGLIAPYNDPVGYATIGYGHLLHYSRVSPKDKPITKQQARELLRKDIKAKAADHVRAALSAAGYRPTQNEFDALVSFTFNLGPGLLHGDHTMAQAIRSKNRRKIADAFLVYDKAGGKTIPGLKTRRVAERKLFLS